MDLIRRPVAGATRAGRGPSRFIALAAPARFGRGARTLTDTQVRDTWDVPRDLVRDSWTAALDAALDRAREQFGLPATARLVADLHSLLVYEPGQFFLPHQDSEKHDSMTGSLVVTLPTRHTGGELVIYHGDQSRTHRGWASDLALVAFHADRRHEVRPVTSGYRIALTYNLLIEGEASGPEGETTADDEQLASCLRQHFTTRVVHRYRDGDCDPPRRLVYLLDHEYTERALDWSRLKGNDIARTARLRAAAAASDAECALALTEVQETWEAYEPEPVYRRRYRDKPDEGQDGDAFELQYLIDSSITITHWVNQAGDSTSTSLTVSGDEVCVLRLIADEAGLHGDAWVDDLLTTWFGRGAAWSPGTPDRTTWLTSLPALTAALLKVKRHSRMTATRLLELAWDSLRRMLEEALATTTPSRKATALTALGEPLAGPVDGRSDDRGRWPADLDDPTPAVEAASRSWRPWATQSASPRPRRPGMAHHEVVKG